MLSADLSEEVDVVPLPGGRILYGVPDNSRLYGDDPVFLRAVVEAMRLEIERLEKELSKRPLPSKPKKRPAVGRSSAHK